MADGGETLGEKRDARAWRGTLNALAASLVGIGLARFAYSPLIPALIEAGWFAPAEAAYLGAANLAGYLAGALAGRRLAARAGTTPVLRAMMLLATASFFASASPVAFAWFFLWRFAAGVAGGALMVLAAPSVLPHVEPARRGLAGGIIFTGVGLGIAASGTLVPLLLGAGLAATWLGLGALALALTGLAWSGWPAAPGAARATAAAPRRDPRLAALYLVYALGAFGLVPHMVFLVDFVARGQGAGIEAGAVQWILFGIGAVAGPLAAGALADRLGVLAALRLALALEAAAVALPLLDGFAALALSSLLVGAFVPGIVPLALGRVTALLPGDAAAQGAAWSRATVGFALGQALGAYVCSFLFAQTSGYGALFGLGAGTLALALAIDLAAGGAPRGPARSLSPRRPGAR
jgi:predicted MFS family arabinose efflux permease